jgi:hypothetical protein
VVFSIQGVHHVDPDTDRYSFHVSSLSQRKNLGVLAGSVVAVVDHDMVRDRRSCSDDNWHVVSRSGVELDIPLGWNLLR